MKRNCLTFLFISLPFISNSQPVERGANYQPDGRGIVCTNGANRYTRALYSANSFFRVETSDVPVFAIYQNKKECCNLSFTIKIGGNALRLDSAEHCTARYEAGLRSYVVRDSRWGEGEMRLSVVADKRREGGLWRMEAVGFKEAVGVEACLCETATQKFPRLGDIGSFYKKGCYEASPDRKNLRTASLSLNPVGYVAVDGGAKATLTAAPEALAARYAEAEADRQALASMVEITTPDPYLNALGGNLVAAADGAWDGETWQHGAVGWRMPLPGWRAAYAGDFLGWPARQESHFAAYAASMVTGEPVRLPHEQDSTHNLARGVYKWGTPMYSDGYICRTPRKNHQFHHYDMNLAYMDELMWHFQFDADTAAMRRLWPTVKSHLEWEKRTWDPDGDGLYDAYCCIWASDALQYHSGAVTHSSAYNYRANRLAARMATLIGEDPTPYSEEASRILKAMDAQLWMADKGVWAEYKDFMGLKRLHDSPALWTVYTAIDSRACTPRQAWEATRWVDGHTPHIPYIYNGKTYETLATTNWAPYEWSINNVAMAEVMHTALAYYEAGRAEEATRLLEACVIDFQYASASPGNFGQLSRLDRNTGEGYRDFADVVGISSRTVVQGLFGITPQALEGRCYVRPGFPAAWDSASIHTPYMDYTFRRSGGKDIHEIRQRFAQPLQIVLQQNVGKGATRDFVGSADSLVRFEIPTIKVEEPPVVAIKQSESNPSAETGEVDARRCKPVDITAAMNASVTDIFKNEYLSPRSPYTTLSLPKQGIGDWCSTKRTADIDDAFLRASGGSVSVAGVPFATPAKGYNIIYTSLWDNYPDSVTIGLKGKASRLHLLMAGSTNPMQSQFVNGEVTLAYADGTTTTLPLRNPDNWCPIEQDYDCDPWAFSLPQPRPYRLALKTGLVSRTLAEDMGATGTGTSSDVPFGKKPTLTIPGGAAQLLTIEANPNKKLRSLTLKTTANDVVIGLLGVTVER